MKKTNRGSAFEEIRKAVALSVENGQRLASASKSFKIGINILKHYRLHGQKSRWCN